MEYIDWEIHIHFILHVIFSQMNDKLEHNKLAFGATTKYQTHTKTGLNLYNMSIVALIPTYVCFPVCGWLE